MNKKQWFGTAMAAVMMSTALVGCGAGNEEKQTGEGGLDAEQELHLSIGDDLPTTDLAKAQDVYSFNLLSATMEGLVRLDKEGEAKPGLATSWDVSQDGLTYKFTLRDGVKWSNGDLVTAKDFEYSWKRTLAPESASQYSFLLGMIKGANAYNQGQGPVDQVGVKALDDKTLEVKLEAPTPFFLKQMAFPTFFPLNQKFVEQKGKDFGANLDSTLAVGPFKMTDWQHDVSVTIEKNQDYWDAGTVKLNKVIFNVIKDSNAGLNMYEAGELDRTGLVRDQIDRYKDKEDYVVTPELTNGYLIFNSAIKGLNNAKVRTALTWAVDRDMYSNIIYNNGTVGATGFVPNGTSDSAGGEFRKTAGDTLTKHEAAEAKSMLEAGLKELGMKPEDLKLKLLLDDSDVAKKAGEFLKEQWRSKLGIDVELDSVPFKLRMSRENKKDYMISSSLWGADYNDPMTFLDLWTSTNVQNTVGYNNPEYDKLIAQARVTADVKQRAQLLVEAEKMLMQDMPIGPLFFRAKAVAMKPYVKDYISRSYGVDFELKWAYIQGK